MATAYHDTTQSVAIDSPEGKKLLRKIVRERHDWRFSANASDGWKLSFSRDFKGKTGEPDTTVIIEADTTIPILTGWNEERDRMHPAPRWVSGRCASTVARLLLGGCMLGLRCSDGSRKTREHGISFSSLVARYPDSFDEITIDTTTYVNGSPVLGGVVS